MTPRSALVVVAVSALLTACAPTADKKASMTPDEARTRLSADIVKVLEAGVPGGAPKVDTSGLNDGIPCGGLEGNEFNKIEHGINALTTKPAPDPAAALRRMRATLENLGYQTTVEDMGDYDVLVFSGNDDSGGNIQVEESGLVSVDASTPCLDNPDQ